MKKRTVLTTILAIVCCISCMFFAACKQKVTVSFETAGTPIAAVQVNKGENYTLPQPGARDGYDFQGWYLSADFSGSPVTSVKAEQNTTVYAKWEQVVTVELDVAGGTLPTGKSATIKTSVGKKAAELLQDYTPAKSGAQFYAWYSGSRMVNEDTVVPASGLKLTAKYKYQYKIIVRIASSEDATKYEEDKDRSSEGYELEGKTISAPKFAGLKLSSGEGGTIKADGGNTFIFNYDRENVSLTFNSNYPGDEENRIERINVEFDSEVEAPFKPEYEGYMFVGWATEKTGSVKYRSYLSKDEIYNGSDDRPASDEIVAEGGEILYAVWEKAYTNMFVSSDAVSDLVYLIEENDETVAYLYRSGMYFKGSFDADTSTFRFRPKQTGTNIVGKIINAENYVYQDLEQTENVEYYEYKLSAGLFSVSAKMDENVTMKFDRFNGVTYTVKADENGNLYETPKSSTGNYIINDSAYEVTFTDGDFKGETLHFIRGVANGNYLFQIRDDEERGKVYNYSYVSGSELVIVSKDTGYYLELDGYGSGVLHYGSQTQSVYCFYNKSGNIDVFVNGTRSGTFAIVEKNGTKGFISYTSSLDQEFKNGEKTLTLDGAYQASYFDGSIMHDGAYTRVATSTLGGTIVKFNSINGSYYFIVNTVKNTDNTYSYTFKEVASNYSEMSYVRGTSLVSGRLFVIDGDTMTVYGVDKSGNYIELANGSYSEENGEKVFVVKKALTAEEIAEKEIQPVEVEEDNKYFFEYCTNFSTVERIVFKTSLVSSNGSTVTVAYWSTVECKGESSDLNEATEYTDVNGGLAKLYIFGNRETSDSETGETEISLGIFATYIDEDGNSYSGLFRQSSNFYYLAVSGTDSSGTTSTSYFGFDVDTENKTFLPYDYMPRSALAVDKDGQLTASEYLTLDGKGGAKHVTVTTDKDGKDVENIVEGTIETTDETIGGVSVYRFTANDGSEVFDAIIFTAGNYNAFAKKNNDFVGDYQGTFLGAERTLTLDGYILAKFTTDGETSGSMYYFTTKVEDQVMIILSSSSASYTYYFDLNLTNKTYTVRNSAYGDFLVIKNQSTTGMWFELDGYGTVEDYEAGVAHAVVKDYKRDENGNFLRDGDGNYIEYTVSDEATYKFDTENGSTYFYIKYEEKNPDDGSVKNIVTLKGLLTTVSISGSTYAAFVEVTTEIEEVYVNDADWSVLILTSYGVARKIDGRTGTATDGNYQLITLDESGNGMIYFATDSEAGVYKFNTQTRTLNKVEITYEKGYYTEELYSFYFSLEGYADYAKGTEKIRYYYDVDDAGNITLYYQDWYNSDCNEYGFVERAFGKHADDTMVWEGDTFYATGGSTVSFVRNADNAKKYAWVYGGTKYYFGNIEFKPNGSDEFSITAKIELLLENGEKYMVDGKAQTLSGYIKREILEKEVVEGDETRTEEYTRNYLQIAMSDGSNFTFDVDLKFAGSANSTYSVKNEEWVMTGSSYRYNEGMMSLYLNYFQTGKLDQTQLAAVQALDYGSITFKRIYDENGDEIVAERTIIAEFTDAYNPLQNNDGSYWKFLDQQSSKPTTKGEGDNRKNVTVIEAKGFEILNSAFKFRMKDGLDRDYMISVKFQSSQYFSGYGFYFDAISTYNEFDKEIDGTQYRVAVERILWTENESETVTAGRIYWVSVGKVGEDFETVSYARYGFTEDGEIDYDSKWVITRTIGKVKVEKTTGSGDDKKTEWTEVDGYVTSRLYKIKFTSNAEGDAYEKADFTVEELKVAYSKDGSIFIEYTEDAEGKIGIVTYNAYSSLYGYNAYFANGSTYVNENGLEYCSVTLYNNEPTYYVVINRNEDGSIAYMSFTTEDPASAETEQAA